MPTSNQSVIQQLWIPGGNGRRMEWGTGQLIAGTAEIPTSLRQVHSVQLTPNGTHANGTANLYVNVSLDAQGFYTPGTTNAVNVKSDWTNAASTAQFWFHFIGF